MTRDCWSSAAAGARAWRRSRSLLTQAARHLLELGYAHGYTRAEMVRLLEDLP